MVTGVTSYPNVQPGFITGSFALMNANGQSVVNPQALPFTQQSGYYLPPAFTYPPPTLPPYTQPPPQATQIGGVEDWKTQKLQQLQSNPLIADIQAGGNKPCDADAFGAVYTASVQTGNGPASTQPQMSVTVRASLLRVRLAKLTERLPTQGASLQQVYKQKAAGIEKAR